MSNEVVIKSNKYGIRLILDDKISFPKLLKVIEEKFRETGAFFRNAKMAVAFEGRELNPEEEQAVIDTIMSNSQIQVVCIMDRDDGLEEKMRQRVKMMEGMSASNAGSRQMTAPAPAEDIEPAVPAADFYRGNLRSGQILECSSSVTLIGDVNPGAKIISDGSIVVLGSLKGNAQAGAAGDNGCFIYALDMRPIQLQIGEYIAKSPDRDADKRRLRRKEKELSDNASRVAVVRDGMICIEPMTKGCLNHI